MSEKKSIVKKITDRLKGYKKSMNKIIYFFGVILIIITSLILVDYYKLIFLSTKILNTLKTLIFIVGIYLLASLILRFTSTWVTKFLKDIETKLIIAKLYSFGIYLIATIIVFWKIGVKVENIVLFTGLITTGLAFALREVLLSMFVWFILLVKKPFRIGENIKIGDEEGLVKHIGVFYVLLSTTQNNFDEYIKIPNKTFIDKSIYNYKKKPVPLNISVVLKGEQKNLEQKMKNLNEKIDFVKIYKAPSIEGVKEYIYLKVAVFSEYQEREKNKTKIVQLILDIFK